MNIYSSRPNPIQNSCKMRYKKNNLKIRNKTVDSLYFKRRLLSNQDSDRSEIWKLAQFHDQKCIPLNNISMCGGKSRQRACFIDNLSHSIPLELYTTIWSYLGMLGRQKEEVPCLYEAPKCYFNSYKWKIVFNKRCVGLPGSQVVLHQRNC